MSRHATADTSAQIGATIAAALRPLWTPGDVHELRIPLGTRRTVAGYFDSPESLAGAAVAWVGKAPGLYWTLNPVDPRLHARARNRLDPYAKSTTNDADIIRRRIFLLDPDPVRPAGISSTDGEHQAAIERASAIDSGLRARGWPAPVLADSGNGAHLLYAVDLPNDEASRELLRRVLHALAAAFDDDVCALDTGVFNASRISKVYGTLVKKGDETPDRHHRRAKILYQPGSWEPVPSELLQAVATVEPMDTPPALPARRTDRSAVPSLEEVRAMLRCIPPTGDYQDHWLKVLMAVHEAYPGPEGIQLCEEWSPGKDGEIAGKFVSFKRAGVGVGSLFHLAREHGYRPAGPQGQTNGHVADVSSFRAPRAGAGVSPPESAPDGAPVAGSHAFALTDMGNAERFIAQHGANIRYCHPQGRWYCFTGQRWERDQAGALIRLAKKTVRSIYREAADEPEDDRRKEIVGWAKRSEAKDRVSAMLILAQSEVPILPEELDRNHWLLNVQNGTIELRTGRIREHRRVDFLTKQAPVRYDPEAPSPRWDAFLARIMAGNQELIGFLRRAAGYSLTGSTREECLFFLHGAGANGKSKFVGAMHSALGDYASTAAPDLLMAKRGDANHPTELADLFGRRFVSTIEAEDGRRFAESLLKQLTGGDKIKGRGMREDFWEFEPSHKFWLAANHKPVIRGTDRGIWRRIHLVPFEVTIPSEEQDKRLAEKLDAERAGILRWLVEGCMEWQREGLQPPTEVQAATAEYRQEMDTLADFLIECCTTEPDARSTAKVLYKAYAEWCDQVGERAESQKALGARLIERGLHHVRTKAGYVWHGVGVRATDGDADQDAEKVNHVGRVNHGEPNSDISEDVSLMSGSCGNSAHHGSSLLASSLVECSGDESHGSPFLAIGEPSSGEIDELYAPDAESETI